MLLVASGLATRNQTKTKTARVKKEAGGRWGFVQSATNEDARFLRYESRTLDSRTCIFPNCSQAVQCVVSCSKRLMHFSTLFNIYNFADSITFRFVFLSVLQVKGDFILILAFASNHLSVWVDWSGGVVEARRGEVRGGEVR